MEIFRITYVSTACADIAASDLQDILATARVRNAQRDVTGLLAFNGANFMQTLEGSRDDVDATLARISADARHSGLIVIEARDVPERAFAGWWMHSVDVRRTPLKSHATNGFDATNLGRALLEQLQALYESFNSLSAIAAS